MATARTCNQCSPDWVVNADGTGKHYVTPGGRSNWLPSWSPDGRSIVYEHALLVAGTLRRHIYEMPVSGGLPVDLTPNELSVRSPMWRRVAGGAN